MRQTPKRAPQEPMTVAPGQERKRRSPGLNILHAGAPEERMKPQPRNIANAATRSHPPGARHINPKSLKSHSRP